MRMRCTVQKSACAAVRSYRTALSRRSTKTDGARRALDANTRERPAIVIDHKPALTLAARQAGSQARIHVDIYIYIYIHT